MNKPQNSLPQSIQGLRFVKNEKGEWEQKIVDITEEFLQTKDRGIVLVGRISHIKDQIVYALDSGLIKEDTLIVVDKKSLSETDPQGFDNIVENLRQERDFPDLVLRINSEIGDIFKITKKDSEFFQRKKFHHQYIPKTHPKKSPQTIRPKQRRK